jgi:hypothetical protein
MYNKLLAETCGTWGLVLTILLLREFSLTQYRGGWQHLWREDYFIVVAFFFYTGLCVFVNLVAKFQTNLMTPEEEIFLEQNSIHRRIVGSIFVFCAEQCACLNIWIIKMCLILNFSRFGG